VITGPSDIPHTRSTARWSLGAVLAHREIDDHTVVVLTRADVGLTTIVVDAGEANRAADPMVATLMRSRRTGLELADDFDDG
jgi:hypothetical protein